jgi:hypothetical protein
MPPEEFHPGKWGRLLLFLGWRQILCQARGFLARVLAMIPRPGTTGSAVAYHMVREAHADILIIKRGLAVLADVLSWAKPRDGRDKRPVQMRRDRWGPNWEI